MSEKSDFSEYRSTTGAEVKTADMSSDTNPLREVVGNSEESRERKYDPTIAGERFVQWYDDSAAAIREYLSNAETACIRRAREELLDAGFIEAEIPDEVSDLLSIAKKVADYEPVVEVEYRRKASDDRLVIRDNGIGISTEEYQVVQRIGYSTSHDSGERLGEFGMGWMSGFQLTGVHGLFSMETRSYLTDEAYGTIEYVSNYEITDDARESYGTEFTFPSFCETAQNIDVPSKVAEFADGMIVPVIYRDFDESGNETSQSDDYLPSLLEDDYDEGYVIVYEDEFFKAVMGKTTPNRDYITYNISMPIRRNTGGYRSNKRFSAPNKWDFRSKREDGPIVHCDSDESIVGLVPIEDSKYERMDENMKEDAIRKSVVPDDAIVMPRPASSRDSFKSGHDDFWRYVSKKLKAKWKKEVAKIIEDIDTVNDVKSLDDGERKLLQRGVKKCIYGNNGNIQERFSSEFGVDMDEDTCRMLKLLPSSILCVREGSGRAHTKSACTKRKVIDIIESYEDVYMAKSVSQKKAEMAWDLGNNAVVRLEDTDYDDYEETLGWKKLKELPDYNIGDKLPDLSDDIVDEYDNKTASESNNTRSKQSGDAGNPKTYRATVRVGSRRPSVISHIKVSRLEEMLEDDERFWAGTSKCSYLVIYKEDNISATGAGNNANRRRGVATARVPEYVYEYLSDVDNVYESVDELQEAMEGVEITLEDGSTEDITDLPATDCIIVAPEHVENLAANDPASFLESIGVDASSFDRFTFCNGDDFSESWGCETDATVLKFRGAGGMYDFNDYTYIDKNKTDLLVASELDIDEDSALYDALFGRRYGEIQYGTAKTIVDGLEDTKFGN